MWNTQLQKTYLWVQASVNGEFHKSIIFTLSVMCFQSLCCCLPNLADPVMDRMKNAQNVIKMHFKSMIARSAEYRTSCLRHVMMFCIRQTLQRSPSVVSLVLLTFVWLCSGNFMNNWWICGHATIPWKSCTVKWSLSSLFSQVCPEIPEAISSAFGYSGGSEAERSKNKLPRTMLRLYLQSAPVNSTK